MKKYKLLKDDFIKLPSGEKAYRIEALLDFGLVKKGDKGGFVQNKYNLSHEGNAWIFGDARVIENALVTGNALVCHNARVSGKAWVTGDAVVCENARVSGNAWVSGNAVLDGNSWVSGR